MQGNQVEILYVILAVMVFILMILIAFYLIFKLKSKSKAKENIIKEQNDINEANDNYKSKIQQSYDVKSVFKFMEFDKVEDNMIVQKNGKRFLMVIKCQGINYDLMSGVEKTSVEQGFIQYLNTLRYPIQIYVQTRTVDLSESINTYKNRVKIIGDDLANKEFKYNQNIRSGLDDKKEISKEKFEVARARNLYEYGLDIVANTERMSLNKGILSKQYYIIIPYYPEEANSTNYAKEEVSNAAFAELYTRAQSTIGLLSVCGINGKILDSFELANLLYMAYNRDDAEIYDLHKALNAGFDDMYITAPNVLDKRMKELDKYIEQEAIKKANEKVLQIKEESEKERALKQKERELSDAIAKMTKLILENNKSILGDEVVEKAKESIDNESKEKGEGNNVQKQVKKTRGTKRTA